MKKDKKPTGSYNDPLKDMKANTFGGLIKAIREKKGLPIAEIAVKLGESEEYIAELEDDKIYPPMGSRLRRMQEVYSFGDEIADNVFYEMAMMQQTKVLPPMAQHIAENWFTRYLITLLMQLDLDPARSTEEGDIGIRIRSEIFNLAKKRGITLKPFMTMFVGEDDEE
jgi:transcriptional regulator with XRE-family HTH domain